MQAEYWIISLTNRSLFLDLPNWMQTKLAANLEEVEILGHNCLVGESTTLISCTRIQVEEIKSTLIKKFEKGFHYRVLKLSNQNLGFVTSRGHGEGVYWESNTVGEKPFRR
jgi:hypothetical protein